MHILLRGHPRHAITGRHLSWRTLSSPPHQQIIHTHHNIIIRNGDMVICQFLLQSLDMYLQLLALEEFEYAVVVFLIRETKEKYKKMIVTWMNYPFFGGLQLLDRVCMRLLHCHKHT